MRWKMKRLKSGKYPRHSGICYRVFYWSQHKKALSTRHHPVLCHMWLTGCWVSADERRYWKFLGAISGFQRTPSAQQASSLPHNHSVEKGKSKKVIHWPQFEEDIILDLLCFSALFHWRKNSIRNSVKKPSHTSHESNGLCDVLTTVWLLTCCPLGWQFPLVLRRQLNWTPSRMKYALKAPRVRESYFGRLDEISRGCRML